MPCSCACSCCGESKGSRRTEEEDIKLFQVFRKKQPAPPSPPLGTDYLTALPSEILSLIFEHLPERHVRESPVTAVSKRLLPFTLRHTYRKVTLYSNRDVLQFVRTICPVRFRDVSRGAYLGSLVEEFAVLFHEVEEQPAKERGMPSPFFQCSDLHALFSNLTNVKVLQVQRAMKVLEALLCYPPEGQRFPRLHDLSIIGRYPIHTNPFNTRVAQFVSSCQRLTYLYIALLPPIQAHRTTHYSEPFSTAIRHYYCPTESVDTSRITDLTLMGVTDNSFGIPSFLASFRNLEKLAIGHLDLGVQWDPLLCRISPTLVFLQLSRAPGARDHGDEVGFSSAHQYLPNLQTLVLGRHALTNSALLTLRHFKELKTLRFDEMAHLTTFQLRLLVSESNAPPKLETLDIKFLGGEIGRYLDDSEETLYDETLDDLDYHGWYLPEWKMDFTVEHARAYVKDAAKRGIKVEGIPRGIATQDALDAYAPKWLARSARRRAKTEEKLEYWRRWSKGQLGRVRSVEDADN